MRGSEKGFVSIGVGRVGQGSVVPTRNSVHSVIIEVRKFRLLTSHTGNLVEEPRMLCVPFPGVIYNIRTSEAAGTTDLPEFCRNAPALYAALAAYE